MAGTGNQNAGLSWRLYKNELDKRQVAEMCKNVFGGTDRLPCLLNIFAEHDACLPLVATRGQEVVAFCNLKRLESDDDIRDVVFLEKVRVSEENRRKGIGTALVREAIKVCDAWCGSGRCTRLLSTTIPANLGMLKIYKTTGWACRGVVELWPSSKERQKVMKTGTTICRGFMDALQLSELIPRHAVESLALWEKVDTRSQVWTTMHSIQAHGGSMVIPGYFEVETVSNAANMTTGNGRSDARSLWKLERKASPPILLFVQKAKADRLNSLPCDLLSACVVDIAGAEACVAFASSLKDMDAFVISYDPAITKDKMKSSTLLSKVDTNTFMIYETST